MNDDYRRRMTEENDIVVAEGTVRTKRKDGAILNLMFCDVFDMRDARIPWMVNCEKGD